MTENGHVHIKDMSTAVLVALAENQTRVIQEWLDMTPERRMQPGRSKGGLAVNVSMTVTIPLCVMFLREIHSRGIQTGWEWLVEVHDEATEARSA